ncbi:hypothetical protein [Pseudonocardia nigra]|uniref:hypothetical protein n=1 Tax=Pseudonocardia nigra TaxID=1921578 RepID=UPI001C5DA576|nr:hypothetical protein [Pseudonocardia nigra]
MPAADLHSPPDCVAAVTGDLAAEFAGLLPFEVVSEEVASAEHDLRGQVSAPALAELLHRLAGHRCQERAMAQLQHAATDAVD